MGRVTIDLDTRRRTAGVLALLAWVLFAAGPARAAQTEKEEGKALAAEQKEEQKEKEREEEGKQEERSSLDHVVDSYHIELFESFGRRTIDLPHRDFEIAGHTVTLGLSKFMLLELIAAILIALLYIPLGRRLSSGELPAGWHHNLRDVLLTFVRDDIARPAIGEHDADRYVPFLWTLFLFILVNDLLGMIPFCGSPTGNIYVTGGLALCAFFAIHGSAAAKMGFGHYMASMWPQFELPLVLAIFIKPLIFALEWVGVLVRNAVLAVRLFANMFAGHVVLATILIFIFVAGSAGYGLWGTVTAASVLGQVALSLLELFVACLQAYIFTFLTALFMGMAMHPAH